MGIDFNPEKVRQALENLNSSSSSGAVKPKQMSPEEFREAVRKLNEKTTNIDVSKLDTFNLDDLDDNTTSITDKDGNLKPGASPEAALNGDGTLKPGWSVGADGVPKFSRRAQFEESAKQSAGNDSGFGGYEDPFHPEKKGKDIDPGFDGTIEIPDSNHPGETIRINKTDIKIVDGKLIIPEDKNSRFDRPKYGVKITPTYEVKDGKLVQTGQIFEEDKSAGFY